MSAQLEQIRESATARPFVTLVIPAFNESRIFERNAEILDHYVRSQARNYFFELIIVNDGSTDETGILAERFAEDREYSVRVFHHLRNSGLGCALRTGFENALGDVVIPVDLDLSYSVEHLDLLLATREQSGADLILLSPYMSRGRVSRVPALRLLLSRGANIVLSWAQAKKLHTSTDMVRAYSRELLSGMTLSSSGMEINLETLLKSVKAGATIKEIPAHLNREHRLQDGEPVFRLSLKRLARQIALVLRYTWLFRRARPLVLRGVIS